VSTATATQSRPWWEEFTDAWNRFWFTPSDPLPLCILRMGVGASLVLYLLLLSADVTVWMAPHGIMSRDLYQQSVIGDNATNRIAYWSVFNLCRNAAQVQAVHYVFLLIAVLFTAGVLTRVTAVLALAALLQYVHRAPIVASQVEPLLSFLLLYLCLGPCGAALSFDAWRKNPVQRAQALEPTWTATISLRLIQVHLCFFYVMMAAAKLQGDLWWRGEAMWTLMSMTRSRLLDLSFMRTWGYFINFWTQLHLVYELTFAALIWGRLSRPLVLWLGVVLWLMLLLASGMVNFTLLMIVANLAFVPASYWRSRLAIA
jgi:hypothetical protein